MIGDRMIEFCPICGLDVTGQAKRFTCNECFKKNHLQNIYHKLLGENCGDDDKAEELLDQHILSLSRKKKLESL
jgi:hypothetical protein